jgi:hypothetical protein
LKSHSKQEEMTRYPGEQSQQERGGFGKYMQTFNQVQQMLGSGSGGFGGQSNAPPQNQYNSQQNGYHGPPQQQPYYNNQPPPPMYQGMPASQMPMPGCPPAMNGGHMQPPMPQAGIYFSLLIV